jgi:uracil-DNA glycosylase
MLLLPVWEWLEREVFNLPGATFEPGLCFNPYLGFDPSVDRPGADRIRRENLHRYLESFNAWPEALVIGEAPGWRGCRFSGVPFTSEAQLDGRLPFCGERSSLGDRAHREASATIFWQVMQNFHPRFLVWNSLPLHPHRQGQPLSNRTPAPAEIRQAEATLSNLVTLLQPHWVVALGLRAASAAQHLGLAATQARHPGHGGAAAFRAGMEAVFGSQSRPAGDCEA